MLEVKQPTRTTYAALGLGLVLFMVIFGFQVSHLLGQSGDTAGGNTIAQLVYVAGFGAAICAMDPLRDAKRLFVLPISIVAALAWCWLSLTWSLAPAIGMRRVAMVTILAWTTFACVRQLGYARSLSYLRMYLAAAIVISLLIIIALPGYAQQSINGVILLEGAMGWRGVSIEKNAFGSLVAIAMIVFIADGRVGRPLFRWSFAGLALVCLVGSLSKTALAVAVLVLPIAFLLSRFTPARRALLIPAVVYLFVGLFLIRDDLIRPFSDARYDPNAFTGRGLIWNALWPYFQDNTIFGAGFGTFWLIGFDSPVYTYTRLEWVAEIGTGHNGYLDLLVTVGIPGLVLAVAAFFVMPIVKMLVSQDVNPNLKFLVYAVLLYAIGNNFTESTLLARDTFPSVMVYFVVALLFNAGKEAPEPAPFRVGPPVLMNPRFQQERNAVVPAALPESNIIRAAGRPSDNRGRT